MKLKVSGVCALLALATVLGCSSGTDEEAKLDREEMPPPKVFKPNLDQPPPRNRVGEDRKRAMAEANKGGAPAKTAGPAIGTMAPEIEGPDTDGVDFKLSDYRGKVVMLDFWGNW